MKAIEIAANWWADQLFTHTDMNNGEPLHGGLGSLLASLEKAEDRPGDKEKYIEAFKKYVADRLQNHTEVYLGVDYDPDMPLREILKRAGLDENRTHPWKTGMAITERWVQVSCGYGAPRKLLYVDESVQVYEYGSTKIAGEEEISTYKSLALDPKEVSFCRERGYKEKLPDSCWGFGKTPEEAIENCLKAEQEYFNKRGNICVKKI